MSIQLIKEAIKTNLDELVVAEVLGGATITDIKKDPLSADIPSFPHAYLMPPSIESTAADNRSNIRNYIFDIMVLFNAENLSSTTQLEMMIEGILNKFDNDPTLSGTALGGMNPLTSAPAPFQHNGKDLIMVVVQISAQEHVQLTFA